MMRMPSCFRGIADVITAQADGGNLFAGPAERAIKHFAHFCLRGPYLRHCRHRHGRGHG